MRNLDLRRYWAWQRELHQPANGAAVWRFEPPDGPKRILLCDQHAAELAGQERLIEVIKFYDATVKD